MKKKICILLAVAIAGGSIAQAATEQIPLLTSTTVSKDEGWAMGANTFLGANYTGFALFEDFGVYLETTGNGYTFNSWDDETSDRIEFFLYKEWDARPTALGNPNLIFEKDDKIVFKGSISGTRAGTDPSDMLVRVFIKTLGYVNNLAFQVQEQYSDFFDAETLLQPFELSVIFPDQEQDDSQQLLQIGFEITNEWDGSQMDSGTIFFENLEAYIERESTGPATWAGWPIGEMGVVDTGDWLGMVNVTHSPWIWLYTTESYVFIDPDTLGMDGGWAFFNQ